jgi:Collagen triple helix repeat (20 copies)
MRSIFSLVGRRVSYANVTATLALLLAMTGGAFAASKYIISSTKQIKPSVLAQMKGKSGTPGKNGAAGAQGPQGPAGPSGAQGGRGENGSNGSNGSNGADGKAGATGPRGATGPTGQTGFTETLPSGKTETGVWAVNGYNLPEGAEVVGPISFSIPMPSASSVITDGVVLSKTETESGSRPRPSGCEGTLEEPTAPAGKLCVYTQKEEVENGSISSATTNLTTGNGYQVTGAGVEAFFFETPGKVQARGTWAVTAP